MSALRWNRWRVHQDVVSEFGFRRRMEPRGMAAVLSPSEPANRSTALCLHMLDEGAAALRGVFALPAQPETLAAIQQRLVEVEA